MITENLSTLKIHKLTQEQYDRELAAGKINDNNPNGGAWVHISKVWLE